MSVSNSKNLVTVERLNAVIAGENGVWAQTKNHVSTEIGKLDGTISGTAGAGNTLTAFSQTDGKVSATFGAISITKSQVSDFPTSMPPTSHTHGNIQNGGTLNDTAAAAAGNDYVVIRDADNNKIQTSTIKGTDVADAVSKKHSHSSLTLSKTAQAYDGTHTLKLPESDPYSSARTPTSHASPETTYGVGTTSNYGHVKLATGDMNGATNIDGVAVSKNHTHSQYAPVASPTLTGTPKAPTPSAGDDSTQIATTEFVNDAIEQGLKTADALIYKGTVAGGSTGSYGALTPAADKGDLYKVTTDGKIDGIQVEVGDMLICNTDETVAATADNYSTVKNNWDFVQGNTDGVVVGPASATDGNIALFDGTTGKLIKNSSYSPSSFATSGHNHDSVYLKSLGGTVTLQSNTAVKIGTQNGADVKLKLPTIPDAAKDGALKIGLNGATATSKFTANQSTDSTLTFAEGATDGTIAVDGTDVAVHGLGSAAYTPSTDYATSGHTHTTSLASDSGTATVTLTANTTYKLTAGGTSVIFKTPADGNTDTKVKATAKTDNANYKILATASASPTSGNATEAVYDADITLNPSTNTIAANISGIAAKASKIATSAKIGDTNKGVYIAADGTVTAMSYAVNKTVPSNAVFTDTDTKVTSVDNHYTPEEDPTAEQDASGGSAAQLPTASTGTLVQVVTGIKMDGKGHVTGVVSKGLWSPNTDTTYTPQKLGFGYGTCSTAEAIAAKTATLTDYTLTTNGIVAIKFTNAVPDSATLNINSKGAKAIYYRGAAITAGVIQADDTVTLIYNGTYYHVLAIDSGEQEMTDQEVTDLLDLLT